MTADPRYPPTHPHAVLINLARRHNWRLGAEIGVLKGKTLDLLLASIPPLHMIAVDQWQHLPESEDDGAETYARFDMAQCETMARAVADKHGGRCIILKGDSVAMADQATDGSLDFVFIDGAHTEAAVEADIRAWAPKVHANGYITGHDWHWPSVRRALDRVVPGWEAMPQEVWALAKRDYRP